MTNKIATAVEEQSAVSDEIHQNIVTINTATEHTLNVTCESTAATLALTNEINRCHTMVKQFSIRY